MRPLRLSSKDIRRMTTLPRLFAALLIFITAPLHAYTVQEMKDIESKVKVLVAKNTPAVVSLIGEKTSGSGSGVIVNEDGLILTAGHVTRGNDEMVVVFPDGKETRCKVLGSDYARDLGLAQITKPGKYPFAEVGDSATLKTTSFVVALGHPGGFDIRRPPPVRIGRISLTDQGGFLVSDCTLIGGDSGGPLFDLDGRVVGIHSSISESLAYNRDAPVNAAKAVWDRMLKGERWGTLAGTRPEAPVIPKAVLGGVFDEKGPAILKDVLPGSPLAAAGVKAGDTIIHISGYDMKDAKAVIRKIERSKPGDVLELVYVRDETEVTVKVTLISDEEMKKRSSAKPEPKPDVKPGAKPAPPQGAKPAPQQSAKPAPQP